MVNKLKEAFSKAKNSGNLIHCITNPISITLCANSILATGNKPMMAEHPKEVAEITKTSDALFVNLGNITDARLKSIFIAVKTAKKYNIPIVLDMVGIACSSLRKTYVKKLLKHITPDVIKGNYSEIYALYEDAYQSKGVDSETLAQEEITKVAMLLANRFHCVVLASGKTDIVATEDRCAFIANGVSQLSTVTGTGCVLGCLVATFLSVQSAYISAVLACAVLGISGELAESHDANGTFQLKLLDALSAFGEMDIEKNLQLEEIVDETV